LPLRRHERTAFGMIDGHGFKCEPRKHERKKDEKGRKSEDHAFDNEGRGVEVQ
jgi:hypothetical protein